MDRRQFIGFTAITGSGLMAGCLDSFSDSYATLQRFLLINDRDEPATVELRIELDGTDEVVHEDTYEIDSGLDGTFVDCVWPDEPLRILVRNAEDDNWNDFSTADRDGCLILYAEIHDHGTSFFRSTEECPARSPDCHTDVKG
ncbi:hypothetical protein OB955_14990 [Halobacteria archaeon AArc-m2/3/4]|uniref:Tat (Twin-arginine translocation) pathway signal sequence n=1 Tax=Natronoglomus mannanivorans TaxID=2979990 RepID=A0ABT2QGI1_9EURY|nr:hypothetical protein [Halobacteria archaeon AArc-m2/3/4]